jgi:hypothetical protein
VFKVITVLLDEYARNPATAQNRMPLSTLMLAMSAASTPDVPVPAL